MIGDDVGQCERWVHFFQPSLHQNKVSKLLYYASRPCCSDVCLEILWLRKLSFLLKCLWLEWMPIAIWGWCIIFRWHCIIGFVSYWFINVCWRLDALVGNQLCIPVSIQPMATLNENTHL